MLFLTYKCIELDCHYPIYGNYLNCFMNSVLYPHGRLLPYIDDVKTKLDFYQQPKSYFLGVLLLMPFPKAMDNAVSICRIKSDYIYGLRTLATKYISWCSVLFVAH